MFTDDEDALHRLSSEDNILSRLNMDTTSSIQPDQEVSPVVTPVEGGGVDHGVTPSKTSASIAEREEGGDIDPEPSSSFVPPPDPSAALKLNKLISSAFRVHPQGRYAGVRNRTDDENASIAVLGQLIGQETAGELAGASNKQVSHLVRATTSQQMQKEGRHRPQLRQKIEEKGGVIVDRAFKVIEDALTELTPERVRRAKTVQISKIARDMSAIIRDVTPKESNDGPGVHFHIWRPEQAQESDYGEVINVRPVERS